MILNIGGDTPGHRQGRRGPVPLVALAGAAAHGRGPGPGQGGAGIRDP
jgi:hypothetical protein